jgi:hypothetical protein
MSFGGETGENLKKLKIFLSLGNEKTFFQNVSFAACENLGTHPAQAARNSWTKIFVFFPVIFVHSPHTITL